MNRGVDALDEFEDDIRDALNGHLSSTSSSYSKGVNDLVSRQSFDCPKLADTRHRSTPSMMAGMTLLELSLSTQQTLSITTSVRVSSSRFTSTRRLILGEQSMLTSTSQILSRLSLAPARQCLHSRRLWQSSRQISTGMLTISRTFST
jgi:hypothetical protein